MKQELEQRLCIVSDNINLHGNGWWGMRHVFSLENAVVVRMHKHSICIESG